MFKKSAHYSGMRRFIFFTLLICSFFLLCGFDAPEYKNVEICAPDGKIILSRSFLCNPGNKEYIASGMSYESIYDNILAMGFNSRDAVNFMFEGLGDVCERIISERTKKSVDAQVRFRPDGKEKFKYIPARAGASIDRGLFYKELLTSMMYGKGRVRLTVSPVLPEWTEERLREITALRGEFSTNYGYSSEGRKHNIGLAARYLTGAVVQPQAEFSFNKRIGARTEARGFLEGKVIFEGKFVEGIGGGVCQVSTTLYNAALLSDLEILKRYKHTLAVSYVEKSFDAMVSSRTDFVFKNNTEYPVYIAAYADGENLTIRIYGERLPEGLAIERISILKKVVPAPADIIVYDDTLDMGISRVVERGRDGYVSEGYVRKIKNGRIISETLLSTDSYKPMTGTTAIGNRPPAIN